MKRIEILRSRAAAAALLGGAFFLALPAIAEPVPDSGTTVLPPSAAAPSTPAPATSMPSAPATAPAAPKDPNKVDENSASYVAGYSDGCASANLRYAKEAHVKPGRDPKLYDSDNDYHEGWDHGYRKCEDSVSPGALPVMGNSVIM